MEQGTQEAVADAITSLDIGVLIGYFAIVILIGVWVTRSTKSGDDLFLAGRSLTWGIIGVSLFASNISSTTLIGLTGAFSGPVSRPFPNGLNGASTAAHGSTSRA